MVDYFFRHRVLDLNFLEPTPWRHPWYTRAEWDGTEETWRARIVPGFCLSPSGEAVPVVDLREDLAPEETLARLGIESPSSGNTVEARLDEDPRFPLPASGFRAIGTDAAAVAAGAAESVPDFFAERGVLGAQVLDTSGESAVIRINGLVSSRANARLLRACDLVLWHDRLQTTVTPELSGDEVTFTLTLRRPGDYRAGAWVGIERDFAAAEAREAASVLLGEQTDPGRDGLHLATVYLLSPPGTPEGSDPDGTWQPYVKHREFWNVQYLTQTAEITVEPTRIAVPVPQLGLGQLGAAAAIFTEAINQNLAELEAALRRVENAGAFYMA